MDRDAVLHALATSVAEITSALIDFDLAIDSKGYPFDVGRRHAIAEQMDLLGNLLEKDDLNDLASELRDEIAPGGRAP